MRRQQIRSQAHGSEQHHKTTEDDDALQKIPQKEPCALTCQPKCSEPIQAYNRPNNEDDPIGVRNTCDVEWRLHCQLPLGPFPYVRFPGCPILFLFAFDGLEIFLSLLGCGTTKKSGDCEWYEWNWHTTCILLHFSGCRNADIGYDWWRGILVRAVRYSKSKFLTMIAALNVST